MVRKTKLPKVKLQPKTLTTRNFKNFDLVQFSTEVDNIPFDTIRDVSSDVNEQWQTWLDFFLAILNKHSPTVTLKIRGKTAPYVTSEIRKMIRQMDFLKAKEIRLGRNTCGRHINSCETKLAVDYEKVNNSISPKR